MTCADKQVICVLTTPEGLIFTGTNYCNNPQSICPRGPGEDYAKCRQICLQEGHAEIIALRKAGKYAMGSTCRISGINWVCRECQVALFGAGVLSISITT